MVMWVWWNRFWRQGRGARGAMVHFWDGWPSIEGKWEKLTLNRWLNIWSGENRKNTAKLWAVAKHFGCRWMLFSFLFSCARVYFYFLELRCEAVPRQLEIVGRCQSSRSVGGLSRRGNTKRLRPDLSLRDFAGPRLGILGFHHFFPQGGGPMDVDGHIVLETMNLDQNSHYVLDICWLFMAGWWFWTSILLFSRNIGFLMIPSDELIFFGGVAQENQPVLFTIHPLGIH